MAVRLASVLISSYLLHVYQGTGIGASSVYVTGISTVAQEFNVGLGRSVFTVLGNAEGTAGIGQSVGVGTGEPAYLLDVRSPVSTGQAACMSKVTCESLVTSTWMI